MPGASSIIGQCSQCCTCPEAVFDYFPVTSVVCTSKTSSEGADQCGITPYDDGTYDSGDPSAWAFYGQKYTTLTRSGASGFYIERTGGSSAGIDTVRKDCFGGTLTFTGCTSTDGQTYESSFEQDTAPVTPWNDLACDPVDLGQPGFYPGTFWNPANYVSDGLTLTQTAPAAVSDPNGTTTYYSTIFFELTGEVTADDAISDVSHTVSTGCCAYTSEDSGFTDPLSLSPNYLGAGTTSASVTLTMKGEPSTEYDVDLIFKNYDPDMEPLPDTYGQIHVETDEDGYAEVTTDVPQPDAGFTRCFHGIASSLYVLRFLPPVTGNLRIQWIERDGETDVEKCAEWDGVIPEDFSRGDIKTWPYVGPFELPIGSAVVEIETACEGETCP